MTTLTLGHALRAVTYALELAETRYANRPLSVAVCDANGELLSFARMDNAKLLTIELTQRKARTSSRPAAPRRHFYSVCKKSSWILAILPIRVLRRCRAGSRFCTVEMPWSRRGGRFIRAGRS